jgi:hypothetical protein
LSFLIFSQKNTCSTLQTAIYCVLRQKNDNILTFFHFSFFMTIVSAPFASSVSHKISDTISSEKSTQKRTRCEVWTRVMGYHRPVANFNIGKKAEHYSRKHFSETACANSRFCDKFGV